MREKKATPKAFIVIRSFQSIIFSTYIYIYVSLVSEMCKIRKRLLQNRKLQKMFVSWIAV